MASNGRRDQRSIHRNRDNRESFAGPSHLTHMRRLVIGAPVATARVRRSGCAEARRGYWPCAATYAAIASMSSCVRFSTTGFISGDHAPLREPCLKSQSCRTR